MAVAEVVPWLSVPAGTTIERIGVPGRVGLQLIEVATYDAQRRAFEAALEVQDAPEPHANADWVDAARLLATAWRVRVTVQATQIRLTLPEEPRKACFLPSHGENAIAFGFRSLLEICPAKAWAEYSRQIVQRTARIVADAVDYLTPD